MLFFTIENQKRIQIFQANDLDEAINLFYLYIKDKKNEEKLKTTLRLKFVLDNNFENYKKLNYYICNGCLEYKEKNVDQLKLEKIFNE